MPVCKVQVKWGKELLQDVELDTSESVEAFKAQLFDLTGVPVERQKLMAKGMWAGILRDDMNFSTMPLADGALITLIGTSAGVPRPPEKATVFMEDMTTAEAAKTGKVLPAGLINLENTCYLNATVQCLRAVPELRVTLEEYAPPREAGMDPNAGLAVSLKQLYKQLDGSVEAVMPAAFVTTLRTQFPQFAEKGSRGHYKQQDADELYNTVLSCLASQLQASSTRLDMGTARNVVDGLFEVEMDVSYKCLESDDEPEVKRQETARKLVCNIAGGASGLAQVNHLHEGVMLGLESEVEKFSDRLGRNAQWKETKRVNRLPRYLCVQFMRFYWKATPESRDHQGVKCKIMRPVNFPKELDVYKFCSPELQAVLDVPRRAHARMLLEHGPRPGGKGEGKEAGDVGPEASLTSAGEAAAAAAADATKPDAAMAVDDDLHAALAMSMQDGPARTPGFGIPANFRGMYEVFGVVSHKGRSADGGHYIGWVRQEGDKWMCYDDDTVAACTTDDVMKLNGGGDYDMAYLVFYRYKE